MKWEIAKLRKQIEKPNSTVTEIINNLELDWNKIHLVENLVNGIEGRHWIITMNSDKIEDENNLRYGDWHRGWEWSK